MKPLKFYDLKNKKSFSSSKYLFVKKKNPRTKRMTYMVKTTSPKKTECYRIVSEDFYKSKVNGLIHNYHEAHKHISFGDLIYDSIIKELE